MADVAGLVRRLRSSRRTEQLQAAKALAEQALGNAERCQAILVAGGVASLIEALQSNTAALQAAAAWALAKLAHSGGVAAAAANAGAGAIPIAVNLLSSRNDVVTSSAAALLGILTMCGDEHQQPIVAAGALPALVTLLDDRSRSDEMRKAAASALCNLAGGSDDTRHAIVAAGAPAPLVSALGIDCAFEAAAAALGNLARTPQLVAGIAEVGAIPRLVAALQRHSLDNEDRATAAYALNGLARGSPQRSAVIVAAGGAATLVQLLQSADNGDAKSRATIALHTLCTSGQAGAVAAADPANAAAPAFECMRRSDLSRWYPNAQAAQEHFHAALQHLATAPAAAATPPEPVPAASPAKPPAPRVCANSACGATTGKLRRCGGCAAVRYCSALAGAQGRVPAGGGGAGGSSCAGRGRRRIDVGRRAVSLLRVCLVHCLYLCAPRFSLPLAPRPVPLPPLILSCLLPPVLWPRLNTFCVALHCSVVLPPTGAHASPPAALQGQRAAAGG